MKDFIQRNMPIFVIGGITLLTFVFIIVLAQKQQPDKPYLVKVDNQTLFSENTPTKGSPSAPVTLVEFSDFECPACAAYQPSVSNILNKYGDKIYFGYRHFPLPQHPHSEQAAIAAIAAGEQGKFFEYGDILFKNQNALTNDDLLKYAKDLGLDLVKFENDLKRDDLKQRLMDDLKVIYDLKISSTPTFYLNGNLMEIKSFADFEKQITDAIGINNVEEIPMQPVSGTQPQNNTNNTLPSNTQPQVNETGTKKPTLDITYTTEGFSPSTRAVKKNTIVKWTNKTAETIKLKQLIQAYDELRVPIEIKANETFEFELTKTGLFTFEEEISKKFGKLTVLDTKESN